MADATTELLQLARTLERGDPPPDGADLAAVLRGAVAAIERLDERVTRLELGGEGLSAVGPGVF